MNSITRLRIIVAWLIVLVWAASVVLDASLRTYEVPATVHGLMLILAGFLFGPTITGRNGKREDE